MPGDARLSKCGGASITNARDRHPCRGAVALILRGIGDTREVLYSCSRSHPKRPSPNGLQPGLVRYRQNEKIERFTAY